MDRYNNNFNENQGMDSDNNANTQQNAVPQEPQINQADLYAPYNQPQTENTQESIPQQNVYAQNNQNGYYQPQQNINQQGMNAYQQNNQYPVYNQQQNNNPYDGEYNQPPYAQNGQNNYSTYDQPQQYNDAYYNQQYPIYNFQEKPKGFAIASMILGIFSTFFSCCFGFFTILSSIAGLVLGIVSIKRNEGGKGMAIAGIILSSVGIMFSIISIIIWIFEIIVGSSVSPYYYHYYY